MFGLENGEFYLALAVGVVVLWVHARSQFNQLSLEHAGDFRRLLSKLQSSDLRASAEYRRAFIIYATILTVLYVVLCIYAAVPDLQMVVRELAGSEFGKYVDLANVGASTIPKQVLTPTAGVAFDEAGGLLGTVDNRSGLSPTIPLAVSLAAVGLAPNVPWLRRVEEFIRGVAHRLAGIPTRLVNGSLALSDEEFVSRTEHKGLLLSRDEWSLLAHYRKELDRDFAANVVRVIAMREWIMHGGELAPRGTVPESYARIERDVADKIEKFLRDLNTSLAKAKGELAQASTTGEPAPTVTAQTDWELLRRDARDTWEDVCLLLGLYGEQRPYTAWLRKVAESKSNAERSAVAGRLSKALEESSLTQNSDSMGTLIFFRVSIVVMAVSFICGLVLGDDRSADGGVQGAISLAITYSTTALLTLVFPLCFALHYQQQMANTNQWHNWESHIKYSQFIPQYVFLFTASLLIGFVGYFSFQFISGLLKIGFEEIRAALSSFVGFAVKLSLTEAAKGAALAILVVATIDCWKAGKLRQWRGRIAWAQVAIFATVALGVRAYASWISGVGDVNVYLTGLWRAFFPAVMIGWISAIYVAATLHEEFSPKPDATQE